MTDRPQTSLPPPPDAEPLGSTTAADAAAEVTEHRAAGWVHRLSSVLFIVFCFELGLFLLIYPWTDAWSQNYFSWLAANRFHSTWHDFWNNTYFRGAVSGMGLVNVWIAVTEVFRMFGQRHERRG